MTGDENIRVYARLRPLRDEDQQQGEAWRVEGNAIHQVEALNKGQVAAFHLDAVFAGSTRNSEVYQRAAAPLVQQVLAGFNSTLLAYGQTASGKTHTMKGAKEEPGIMPLALEDLLQRASANPGREFLMRVSYMEVYNEQISDLLRPALAQPQTVQTSGRGLYEVAVSDVKQALAELERGERRRHVGATKMNERSSRSHTLFRIVVESRAKEGSSQDGGVLVGMLNLVDLAGSESAGKTEATGQRQREGGSINKSLLALSKVVEKLSEGRKGAHIPYGDSTLTKVLRSSLGGNSKTAIICTCNPATAHAAETKNTLRFATTAKKVQNRPELNETHSEAALLKRQEKEIAALKQRLAEAGSTHIEEEVQKLRAALLRRDQELAAKHAEMVERQAELASERAERARMQVLLRDSEALQACVHKLQEQNEQLQRQLAASADEARRRVEQLAYELQGTQGERDRLAALIAQLEAQAGQLAAAQRQQSEARIQQHKQALAEAEARLQAQSAQLEAANAAAAEAAERLAASEAAAAAMRGQLAATEQQLSAVHERAAARLQAAQDGFAAELGAAEAELGAQLAEAQQRNGELEGQAEQQAQRAQQAEARAAELQAALQGAQALLEDKEAEWLRQLHAMGDANQRAEQAAAEERQRLQGELSASGEAQESLRQQLADAAEEHVAAEAGWQQQLSAALGEQERLRQLLASLEAGADAGEPGTAAGQVSAIPAVPPVPGQPEDWQPEEQAVSPGMPDWDGAWGEDKSASPDQAPRVAELQQQLAAVEAERDAAAAQAMRLQLQMRRAGDATVLQQELEEQQAEAEAAKEEVGRLQRELSKAQREGASAVAEATAELRRKLDKQSKELRALRKAGREADPLIAEQKDKLLRLQAAAKRSRKQVEEEEGAAELQERASKAPRLGASGSRGQRSREALRPAAQPAASPQAATAAAAAAAAPCVQASPVTRRRQRQQQQHGRAEGGPPLEIPSDGELEMDLASRARSRR